MTFESENKIQPVKRVSVSLILSEQGPTDAAFQFEDAGLHPVMLRNIELCGYKVPTPIQAYCLPSILTGHDIIAVAQTGQ